MKRIAVVGGGLTGLTAALELSDRDNIELSLFEGASMGGKIASAELAGQLLPTGPDAFLSRRPEVTELAIDLGLEAQLIEPSAAKALIARDGRLHPIPRSVLGIPADMDAVQNSALLSADAKDRIRDAFAHPEPPSPDASTKDLSVGSLVRRALGDEVLEYLVDPLLGGINAGDSDLLSVQAGVPQIDALRQEDERLVAAASRRLAQATSGPIFQSLRGGLSTLIEAAHRQLTERGATVRRHSVSCITRSTSNTPLVDGEAFDHVIVATPPAPTQKLLAELPEIADRVGSIEMSSVALLLIEGERSSIDVDSEVSGVLVPRKLSKTITAVSIAHQKWPHLAHPDRALLRVSVGRRHKTEWTQLTDEQLIEAVSDDVEDLFGQRFQQTAVHITRWHDGLPQYDVGHADKIRAIVSNAAAVAPALTLTGAWRDGLGLPACVASGRLAAHEALKALAD